MPNVSCLWTPIFFWMRELKLEKKMCTKVTMLNDFRSRWNGDTWLFFSNKVMLLYTYFLSSVHMQNMYMKHSCMFLSLNDRHALLIIVCYNNRIMIIIFFLQPFDTSFCSATHGVAVSLKNVSCTQYCITNCISFSVRYHYFVFNFSIMINN